MITFRQPLADINKWPFTKPSKKIRPLVEVFAFFVCLVGIPVMVVLEWWKRR